MTEIVLLGSGNVATHLFEAFRSSGNAQVIQVFNHSENHLDYFKSFVPVVTSLEKLMNADVYLLALKDDVIPMISEKLKDKKGLVAHTSGAVSIDSLSTERRGVFYPLQTFSRERALDYGEIPFCLEANSEEDLGILQQMAREVSGKHYEIDSAQRKKLHLSAVFVCNFVNHLYAVGEKICKENEMPFEILEPLIQETAGKIKNSSPSLVQTGPAIRNDQSTINSHLELLSTGKDKEIYQLLTTAIQSFHGKKL